MKTQILIIGGGTGAVAAALAIARHGHECILTEPTDWIGGQLTSQAVPPDENRWIEGDNQIQSATRSYLDFRKNVRQWYRDHRPLTETARSNPRLNPGNGWVSYLCHEPLAGHAVLMQMLQPHLDNGRVTILLHVEPVSADPDDDINAVRDLMINEHIRRVPVTGENGVLVGIIAQADLAREDAAADDREVGEIVEAISEANPND